LAFPTCVLAFHAVCVSDGFVYVAGVQLKPDSDEVLKDRVLMFDTSGNYIETLFEVEGEETDIPRIKALADAPDGVIVAAEEDALRKIDDFDMWMPGVCLVTLGVDGSKRRHYIDVGDYVARDIGCSPDGKQYAALNYLGTLTATSGIKVRKGQVLISVDMSDDGSLY
jgi:hypothetical protein